MLVMRNSSNSPFTRFEPCLFWAFIHLLEFDLAHKTVHPAEDTQKGAYHTFPSGHLSPETAHILRWAFLAFCTIWSAHHGKEVLATSIFCNIATYAYNDLGCIGDDHWAHRNIVLALLYLGEEYGAFLIKG